MGRNAAHRPSHFLNRICVIRRCSSAASYSSEASSFCSRRRRISKISVDVFPVAHTIKIRPKRLSYWQLPSASDVMSSLDSEAFFCSSVDQVLDCTPAETFAADWPIRESLQRDSIQSDTPRPRQTCSDVRNSNSSSSIGLLPATPLAQARDPQHGKISTAATSAAIWFQRANISFTRGSRSTQVVREIPHLNLRRYLNR